MYTAPVPSDDTEFLRHLYGISFLTPDLVPEYFIDVVIAVVPASQQYTSLLDVLFDG